MQKQLSLLTISIALLSLLSSTNIQSAAESSAINIEATVKLIKAVQTKNLEIIQQALAQGAAIDGLPNNYEGYRLALEYNLPSFFPLSVAAANGDLAIVKLLLRQGASVDAGNARETPLLALFLAENIPHAITSAIVAELLKYKANVNVRALSFFCTPLMRAICYLKSESIVKQLILAGADRKIKNYEHKTALDMIKTPTMQQAYQEACTILEITKFLNQQNCLPVQNVAAMVIDYLFTPQQ